MSSFEEQSAVMVSAVIVFGVVAIIFMLGHSCGTQSDAAAERFALLYSEKPFCLSEKLGNKEYKPCWKAVEVQP